MSVFMYITVVVGTAAECLFCMIIRNVHNFRPCGLIIDNYTEEHPGE